MEFLLICTFTIPENAHHTKLTIETRSKHLQHAKSEDDVWLQLEKDREIDALLNAKRILKFVKDELWNVKPRDVSVT